MRSALAALILPFAATACGLASFDVPLTGTVPFAAEPAETFVELHDAVIEVPELNGVDITKQKKFEDSGINIDDVKSVELIGLRLKGLEDKPLDFIGKVAFYVEAEGIEKVKIASGEIPEGATLVRLDTESTNLTKYAKTKMKIWAVMDRVKPVDTDTRMEVKATFHVDL